MTDPFVIQVNLALTTIGFEHELSSQYVKKVYRAIIAQKILDYSAEHEQCSNEIMCQIAKSFITDDNVKRQTLNKLMIELQKVSTDPDVQKYEQKITRKRNKKSTVVQSGKSSSLPVNRTIPARGGKFVTVQTTELRKKILTTLIEHDYWNWTFNTETHKLEVQL